MPKERTERQQNIIPTEDMYMPLNHLDYLKEEKYHHSEKGCEIKMIQSKFQKGWITEKICLTHNKQCSKTGWEYGYYNNTDSTKIFKLGEEHWCKKCGTIISTRRTYCKECAKIVSKEKAALRPKKNYYQKLLREPKVIRPKKLPGEMRDGKISILMAYIKEYEKADYHDRIECVEYNEIVKEADRLIKGFIKRKLNRTVYN